MEPGMIDLDRMGASMMRHLLAGCHDCVVFDASRASVVKLWFQESSACEPYSYRLATEGEC